MKSPIHLKKNNFDLLRFVFAGVVFFVHAHVLSKNQEISFLLEMFSSEFAVRGFFVISGFLIFMSYENSSNIKSYFLKRLRRVYPAYVVVVVLCAILGAFVSGASLAEYAVGGGKYLAANLTFLNFVHPTLPGVFAGNSMMEVNGALWTLKIEVLFYISVPIIAWLCKRVGRFPVIAGVYMLSAAYAVLMDHLAEKTGASMYVQLSRQLPGQLSFFMGGALIYYYFDFFERWSRWLFIPAVVLYFKEDVFPLNTMAPMAVAVIVGFLGCFFTYLGNFGKYGDFSYGVYILHFPILQALIAFGLFDKHPYHGLALAATLIMLSAAMLWRYVEKPFLARSSHYVAANK